jgi:hypothetical protein
VAFHAELASNLLPGQLDRLAPRADEQFQGHCTRHSPPRVLDARPTICGRIAFPVAPRTLNLALPHHAQGRCGASVRSRTSIDTMVLTKAGFSIVLNRFPDIQESFLQKRNERNKENTAANKALDRRLDKIAQPPAAEMTQLSPGAAGAVRVLAGQGRPGEAPAGAAPSDTANGSPPARTSKGPPPMLSRTNTVSSLTRGPNGQLRSTHLAEALARRPSLMVFSQRGGDAAPKSMGAAIRKVRGVNNAIRACGKPAASPPALAEAAHAPATGAAPTHPMARPRSSVAKPLQAVMPVTPISIAPRPPADGRGRSGAGREGGGSY